MGRSIFVVIALLLSISSGVGFYFYDSRSTQTVTAVQQDLPEHIGAPTNKEVLGTATQTNQTQTSTAPDTPKPRKKTAVTTRVQRTIPATQPQPTTQVLTEECNLNYIPCVPMLSGIVTCADIGFVVTVKGEDVYGLDPDGNSSACEEYAHQPDMDNSTVVIPLPNPISGQNTDNIDDSISNICNTAFITCENLRLLLNT